MPQKMDQMNHKELSNKICQKKKERKKKRKPNNNNNNNIAFCPKQVGVG
jgi:hypothetical protein